MEKGLQNLNSFHLAGIVPVAGQKLDFNIEDAGLKIDGPDTIDASRNFEGAGAT